MKLNSLVSYLNDEKINLSPVFQRGHVWKVAARRSLVKNIVQGRPIPAIFLYKEAQGAKYSYNILDGKQRLESIILFIGSLREDFKIERWDRYFYGAKDRKDINFWIELPDGKKKFNSLEDDIVRDLGEYAIPTIEISLTDESSLDEIINLFVDINQSGVPVNRFDVVKAMGDKNPLLQSVFDLISRNEKRGQDTFYKAKNNEFTDVLKQLKSISSVSEANARVDRMWERMLEIVLFTRTGNHRPPAEILKGFIRIPDLRPKKVTVGEVSQLRKVFSYLQKAYKTELKQTPLAANQIHFYILVTSLISGNLLEEYDGSELTRKLTAFGKIIEGTEKPPKSLSSTIAKYRELSQKQTTHVGRRDERTELFNKAIEAL